MDSLKLFISHRYASPLLTALLVAVSLQGIGWQTPHTLTGFSGGDGSSLDQAVMIEDELCESAPVIHAEQFWIEHRYPGAIIASNEIARDPLTQGGLPADKVQIVKANGDRVMLYFSYTCLQGQLPVEPSK